MKLRQLALFSLALLMALACFGGTSAKAEREGTHGNLSWNLSADGTLTITAMDPNAWNNCMSDFDEESPAPWLVDDDGNDVRDRIKKVVLGPGVQNCGEIAFENCSNLTTVEMDADSVEGISYNAFANCKNLKSVQFSGNLKVILRCAFEGCTGLTSVTLPATLQTIESGAFACCSISSVKVAEGTAVKTWDFFYPTPDLSKDVLYSVALPANVGTVECGAFFGNPLPYKDLVWDFIIPSEVTEIKEDTFCGTNPHSVWIHDNVTVIGKNAFAGCTSLEYVYLPWEYESFSDSAFPAGTALLVKCGPGGLPYEIRTYAERNGLTVLQYGYPYTGN